MTGTTKNVLAGWLYTDIEKRGPYINLRLDGKKRKREMNHAVLRDGLITASFANEEDAAEYVKFKREQSA